MCYRNLPICDMKVEEEKQGDKERLCRGKKISNKKNERMNINQVE